MSRSILAMHAPSSSRTVTSGPVRFRWADPEWSRVIAVRYVGAAWAPPVFQPTSS